MTVADMKNLRRDMLAGRWLRRNGTKVLIALIDADPKLAYAMCLEAFGMTKQELRASLEEQQRRLEAEKNEREP